MAYQLTEKGEALRAVLRALNHWSLAWQPGTKARMKPQEPS
jgi:DNA-binding HxlR family transcriptional regulator